MRPIGLADWDLMRFDGNAIAFDKAYFFDRHNE